MKRIALILGLCLTGFLQISEAVECKDGETFIPYPKDCSKYYSCVNGVGYEQKCPDGFWFNPANKYCDYPSNIDEKYCPKYECPVGGIDYLPTPYACNEYVLCFDGTPVPQTCAEGLEFDPLIKKCVLIESSTCEILNCPEDSDELVFLPNKKDCGSYYICVKGQPVPQSCADGLHWSVANSRCESNETAGCNAQSFKIALAAMEPIPASTTFSIACPFFGIHFLPSPTECEYYFGCNNGKSHLFECPAGTAWDQTKKTCVYKNLVERCFYKY
uniref:CSON015615 protein n=1 Tax=Culicoides sonorensis TaxID=179676 RepID=A0A336K4N7_CULSO